MLRDRSSCPSRCELPEASLESGVEEERGPSPPFVTKRVFRER